MKIGEKVKVRTNVRRYGGKKGEIIKINSPEFGVNLGTGTLVWFIEPELERTK